MPADAANRTECREELARLTRLAMVTNTQIVDKVFDYETVNVEGDTAIVITFNGSKRQASGINDFRFYNEFIFEVIAFVRKANTLSDNLGGSNWTERDVENKLDDIDKYFADVIANNRAGNTHWSFIDFTDDFSEVIAGRERFIDRISETIPYKVESRLVLIRYLESGG